MPDPTTTIIPAALSDAPFAFDDESGAVVATGAVLDLPALLIAGAVTALLVRGVRESATANAVMVVVKLGVVFFVILVGPLFRTRCVSPRLSPFPALV